MTGGADEVVLVVADGVGMRALGRRIGRLLRAGDVVLLDGPLGAGKTTLTQGIAAGLEVRGPVTSPTFVIARVHPSLVGGPALVHVDAYRVGSGLEIDDLDLDADLDSAVTVVEWGAGPARRLADERLEVRIDRSVGRDAGAGAGDDRAVDPAVTVTAEPAPGDPWAVPTPDPRQVRVTGVGARWTGALEPLRLPPTPTGSEDGSSRGGGEPDRT